jgi:short-subunit dehydrogenase
MKLPDKVAVVTGASRGIGRALARALSGSGCRLLLTALEGDELRSVSDEIAASDGVQVEWLAADLTRDEERRLFVEWVDSRDAPPDILVNNAGSGRFGQFSTSRWGDIQNTLTLDVHVPTRLIHDLLPILQSRPEAAIVNISSASARIPYPGMAVYGASKGYLSSLSETLSCELIDTNVRVLCFHPGFTDTHFMPSAGMDMSRIPDRFILTPELVAGRIVAMLERERAWAYSDLTTRLGVFLSYLLPHRIKSRVFKNLFWTLPDEP